jgi:hypothetical protein
MGAVGAVAMVRFLKRVVKSALRSTIKNDCLWKAFFNVLIDKPNQVIVTLRNFTTYVLDVPDFASSPTRIVLGSVVHVKEPLVRLDQEPFRGNLYCPLKTLPDFMRRMPT